MLVAACFGTVLLTVFCNTGDNGNPVKPVVSSGSTIYGTFLIEYMGTDGIAEYTQLSGVVKDGPTPTPTGFKVSAVASGCTLLVPVVPFCETPCSDGMCVQGDSCMREPDALFAGAAALTGVKTTSGATSILLDTTQKAYLLPDGVSMAFPPFAEGDPIKLTLAGSATVPACTVSTKAISPLILLNDTIALIDGQPIKLSWTPPAQPGTSTISILIDISHHGGLKGLITGECADNGSFEIPATLLAKLKALGTAGFPKIEVTRKAVGKTTATNVSLILESKITKILHIPGLVSCFGDTEGECPDGQTCQHLKCQ